MQSVTPVLAPTTGYDPELTQLSTKTALVQAAKAFGRVAYKSPYLIVQATFEAPSLITETLTGCVGGAVGFLVGSTAVLSRKCMGAKARRFFNIENPGSLRDYAGTGFHTGARLAEFPGRILGGCAVAALGASVLSGGIAIPVLLGLCGMSTLTCSIAVFAASKFTGKDNLSDFTNRLIHDTRIKNLRVHNRLQGIEMIVMDNQMYKELFQMNTESVSNQDPDSDQSSQQDSDSDQSSQEL